MLNRALARLESVERGVAGYEVGPEWIDVLRARRSDVLTSLAVNANVKLRDPEKALAYFERSMELRREDDFSRVMLACYRARAGRAAEARALLRDVPHSPFNDYNLACTYALMGEKDAALDFLRRELLENLSSEGARARQKEWARSDPDLDALHGDPRFEALVR
jgi:tetratricopeptide (TPR) repeat protein